MSIKIIKKCLTRKILCDILCKVFWFTVNFCRNFDIFIMVITMFEKNLNISFLLDFYGDILSERHRNVLDMYYNEDLSLAEIADVLGISRQGVRQAVKKGADELLFFENKLGLANKFKTVSTEAELIMSELEKTDVPASLKARIEALAKAAK